MEYMFNHQRGHLLHGDREAAGIPQKGIDRVGHHGLSVGMFLFRNSGLKEGHLWDGLDRSDSGNLLLVGAKSPYWRSGLSQVTSVTPIKSFDFEDLKECKKYLESKPHIDWARSFYQYTNRLAHLYFLRELNEWPAFLVFVYFVNNKEMKEPESEEEWRGTIKLVRAYLDN